MNQDPTQLFLASLATAKAQLDAALAAYQGAKDAYDKQDALVAEYQRQVDVHINNMNAANANGDQATAAQAYNDAQIASARRDAEIPKKTQLASMMGNAKLDLDARTKEYNDLLASAPESVNQIAVTNAEAQKQNATAISSLSDAFGKKLTQNKTTMYILVGVVVIVIVIGVLTLFRKKLAF